MQARDVTRRGEQQAEREGERLKHGSHDADY